LMSSSNPPNPAPYLPQWFYQRMAGSS